MQFAERRLTTQPASAFCDLSATTRIISIRKPDDRRDRSCGAGAARLTTPTLSADEQTECEQAVLASADFRAALERHYGVTDSSLVMADIWSAGNYGSEEERTRRLVRPLCFLRSDPTENGYARPIEGIRPVVDLNTMEVIRVEEYGEWLPPQAGNYAANRVPTSEPASSHC